MSIATRPPRKFSDRDRSRAATALSKRKPGKASSDPSTSDRTYTDAEFEFLMAMEAYKARTGVRFPMLSEILKVLLSLGYRKEI